LSPFEQGFCDELVKIAINFNPELTAQLMAGGNVGPLPPAIAGIPITKDTALQAGGALMSLAEQQLKETPGGHRFVSHNPRSAISGFQY
jgi:hypothetical protein